jgi:predicted DCC family thiol-disulfide oxidoreductase YuxK
MEQDLINQSNKQETLKVLFDGNCPLCRKEIDLVQGLAVKNPESKLCFIDISQPEGQSDSYEIDRDQLLARFHVEQMDGTRLDGAKAFVAMWDRLPGWKWLARISRIPGMLFVMELAYRGFLKIRPSIQSLVRQFVK